MEKRGFYEAACRRLPGIQPGTLLHCGSKFPCGGIGSASAGPARYPGASAGNGRGGHSESGRPLSEGDIQISAGRHYSGLWVVFQWGSWIAGGKNSSGGSQDRRLYWDFPGIAAQVFGFQQYPGIYWFNHGWIENAFIPTKEHLKKKYQQYREQYGEDNAEYLQQEDRRWISSYQYCGYIRSNGPWEREEYRKLAHQTAVDHGWKSVDVEGDSSMLERLLQGEWSPEECLICPPGYRVEASYDETKIKAVEVKPQEGKEICQKF